jgi:hypothetical protein
MLESSPFQLVTVREPTFQCTTSTWHFDEGDNATSRKQLGITVGRHIAICSLTLNCSWAILKRIITCVGSGPVDYARSQTRVVSPSGPTGRTICARFSCSPKFCGDSRFSFQSGVLYPACRMDIGAYSRPIEGENDSGAVG